MNWNAQFDEIFNSAWDQAAAREHVRRQGRSAPQRTPFLQKASVATDTTSRQGNGFQTGGNPFAGSLFGASARPEGWTLLDLPREKPAPNFPDDNGGMQVAFAAPAAAALANPEMIGLLGAGAMALGSWMGQTLSNAFGGSDTPDMEGAESLPDPDREARCDAQYEKDRVRCNKVTGRYGPNTGETCWETAAGRLAQCLSGQEVTIPLYTKP